MNVMTILILPLLLSTSVFATQTFQVHSGICLGKQLVSQSSLVVKNNSKASMVLGNDLAYDVTINPQSDTQIAVNAILKVDDDSIASDMFVMERQKANI